MPHSVKHKSSSKQGTTANYITGAANNMAAFASNLDAVQATTMMQVWHEERDPSNLTFSECTQLMGELGSSGGGGAAASAGGGGKSKSSSRIASSMSLMRFVAPSTTILDGTPAALDDVRPSHRVMNLAKNVRDGIREALKM
ncbi:hypothetical protein MAPG_05014 [Magnaporthiopsis poae ATCC 64411]|uniref:Uncharacterized protein n=1 Tax=Magnaporthiopsis poae (strain ATCC 64411 / 73-15) TaxID=644358 RepID=A0A0C4DYA2_MAGP6|nr:hypothetical protein MAPG_05014 [Magnaporthiopsis poae ATCC 64411]